MKPTPVVSAPKGMRWPWYPYYTGECEVGELKPAGDGTATASVTLKGPMRKSRVGIRRWVRHITRRR